MRRIVSLPPGLLPLERKKSRYPLDRRLEVPHTQSGRFGEENSFALTGIRTLDRPVRNLFPVLTTTTVYRQHSSAAE
jgi:hypothetical protein